MDMLNDLLRACCLMFVLEGIIPFLYPQRWRSLVQTLSTVDDNNLRMMGLISMLLGVGLLYIVN